MLRLHQHIDFPCLKKKKFLQLQVNDDKTGKIKEGKGGRKEIKEGKKKRIKEKSMEKRKELGTLILVSQHFK